MKTRILAPAGSASLVWGGLGESKVWRRYNFQGTQERAWMWSQRVDLAAQIRLCLWAFVRESYRTCRTMNSHGGWQPVNHSNGTRKDMAYPKVLSRFPPPVFAFHPASQNGKPSAPRVKHLLFTLCLFTFLQHARDQNRGQRRRRDCLATHCLKFQEPELLGSVCQERCLGQLGLWWYCKHVFIYRNGAIGAEHNKNVFLSSLLITQECQRSLGSTDTSGRGPGEPEVAHELGGFRARETLMSFLGLVLLVSR